MEPVLLTVGEAAQAMRISRAFAYQLLARGELASVRVGRCRRVPAAAVHEYVARLVARERDAEAS